MFAFLPAVASVAVRLALSGAALIGSIGFLKSASKPVNTGRNQITEFQIGKLVIYGIGLFLAYKLIRDVMK